MKTREKIQDRGKKSWGQECWGRTAGTGKPGQVSQDRTTRIGQPENVGIEQAGQEREDRMVRT